MTVTYLLTGANKGVGLSIATLLTERDDTKIIATARNPKAATDLQALAQKTKKIDIIDLDMSSQESIAAISSKLEELAPEGIDVVIGNAGTLAPFLKAIEIEYDDYVHAFSINAVSNVYLFKAAYPSLLKKKTRKVVFITSSIGSITQFLPFPGAAYGVSKAAINYLVKSLTTDHGPEGFAIVTAHPGMVKTDMFAEFSTYFPPDTFKNANIITPDESAQSLIKIADKIENADSGKFYDTDGSEHPL